jgi:hypothetical protein
VVFCGVALSNAQIVSMHLYGAMSHRTVQLMISVKETTVFGAHRAPHFLFQNAGFSGGECRTSGRTKWHPYGRGYASRDLARE